LTREVMKSQASRAALNSKVQSSPKEHLHFSNCELKWEQLKAMVLSGQTQQVNPGDSKVPGDGKVPGDSF